MKLTVPPSQLPWCKCLCGWSDWLTRRAVQQSAFWPNHHGTGGSATHTILICPPTIYSVVFNMLTLFIYCSFQHAYSLRILQFSTYLLSLYIVVFNMLTLFSQTTVNCPCTVKTVVFITLALFSQTTVNCSCTVKTVVFITLALFFQTTVNCSCTVKTVVFITLTLFFKKTSKQNTAWLKLGPILHRCRVLQRASLHMKDITHHAKTVNVSLGMFDVCWNCKMCAPSRCGAIYCLMNSYEGHCPKSNNQINSSTNISVSCCSLALIEADDQKKSSDIRCPFNQVCPSQVGKLGLVDLQQL